ncbi:hypothetical protein FIBSPDRAFT_848389 [Athelia psychrophila]|uniref:Uncharacterized protein n=1 Tax=Athelia psychrophila TaxID=1759441 RepID=A0A166VCG0_9AGAM|nr:hypothetical protein FIBSPDRAFT_848389 [Fibularhizoctonia sp. CBS 109695]
MQEGGWGRSAFMRLPGRVVVVVVIHIKQGVPNNKTGEYAQEPRKTARGFRAHR